MVYLGFCPNMTEQWYKLFWGVRLSKAFAGQFPVPHLQGRKKNPVTAAVGRHLYQFQVVADHLPVAGGFA